MTTYTGSDGLTYDFTNNVLTISGSGASTSFVRGTLTTSDSSTVDMKAVTSCTISSGVTSLASYMFANNCTSLLTVSIAGSVTTINMSAFYRCTALTSVTLSEGLLTIGASAFSMCYALQSLNIPASVYSISTGFAPYCTSLPAITVSSGNQRYRAIDGVLFIDYTSNGYTVWELIQYPAGKTALSYSIPSGITSLAYQTFAGCVCLESITFPSGLASIMQSAFYNCTALKTITIPDSVTTLQTGVFTGCTALTSVTIGSGITSIASNMFRGCTALTSITIPSNITSIEYGAFYNCPIENLVIPDTVTTITDTAFTGTSLKTLSIPITLAAYPAIGGTPANLTEVTLTPGSNGVGKNYSAGAAGSLPWNKTAADFVTVTLSSGIVSIGDYTFYNSQKLVAISIPASVTSFGNYVFSQNSTMKLLQFECTASAGPNITFGTQALYFGKYNAQATVYVTSDNNWASGLLNGGSYTTFVYPTTWGHCGPNVIWLLDSSTLTIMGSGPMDDFSPYDSPAAVPEYDTYKSQITTVEFKDKVSVIGSYAFTNYTNLTTVSFTDATGLRKINDDAFIGSGITSLTIPEGVTEIEGAIVHACESLVSIYFPSTLTTIGFLDTQFDMCVSLAKISVSPNNTVFSSISYQNGDVAVLFNKAQTILIRYPPGSPLASYTVPSTVTKLADHAFAYMDGPTADHHNYTTELILPNGLTEMGDAAIYHMERLTGIAFPKTLTTAGSELLNGCIRCTKIVFKGTEPTLGTYPLVLSASSNPVSADVYSKANWAEDVLPEHPNQYTTLTFFDLPPSIRTKVNGSWVIGTPKIKTPYLTNTEMGTFTNTQLEQRTQDDLSAKWVTAKAVYVKVNGVWKESEREV